MGTVQDTLPDICIAYKLHLECGRLINLYDWLQVWSTLFVVLFKWLQFPFSLLLFLLPVINSFSFYQYRTSRMLVLELLIFCMHNGKLAAHSHTLLVSCQLGSSFFSGLHICFGASTSTPVSKGLTKEETENKWTASVSYWSEKIVEIVKCCLLICNSLSVLRDFAGV